MTLISRLSKLELASRPTLQRQLVAVADVSEAEKVRLALAVTGAANNALVVITGVPAAIHTPFANAGEMQCHSSPDSLATLRAKHPERATAPQ
jgi:hypothetical protein